MTADDRDPVGAAVPLATQEARRTAGLIQACILDLQVAYPAAVNDTLNIEAWTENGVPGRLAELRSLAGKVLQVLAQKGTPA